MKQAHAFGFVALLLAWFAGNLDGFTSGIIFVLAVCVCVFALIGAEHEGRTAPIQHIVDHRLRHKALHAALDELLADWLLHSRSSSCYRPVSELMSWSHEQAERPDHRHVL